MADDTALGTLEAQAAGTYTGTETLDAPDTQVTTDTGIDTSPIDGGDQPAGGEPEGGDQPRGGADDLPPYEEVKEFTPKQVYETIRHLREEHGDDPTIKRVLHSMTDSYGRLHGFLQEFPEGVVQAREAKAILESFGGFDGIAELQGLQERADMTDDQLQRGDPVFMQRAAKASPDGFAKLVPEAINILQKTNSEAYERALLGPTLKQLEVGGLPYVLDQAIRELRSGTPDGIARATDWIQRTMGWHQQLQQKFDETQKYARDPRLPEFEKQQASFNQTQREAFFNEVSRRIDEYMRESFTPQVTQLSKGRNISEKAKTDLVNASMAEARNALAKNNIFASRVKAYARGPRSTDTISRAMGVIKAQIDGVRKNSIQNVWTTRYGSVAPRQQPPDDNSNKQPIYPPRTGPGASRGLGLSVENPLPVKQMPPQSEIDMTKDPDRLRLFQGRAFHKPSGKWVAWRGLPGK
jgi:hypothetical protein